MASTKFIRTLGDEELVKGLFDVVGTEADRLVGSDVDRGGDREPFNVWLTYGTRFDGEDEDSTLTDSYEVDDYDIVPFDWGGDTSEIVLRWRKWLFARFGAEYAEWYLVGQLEKAVGDMAGGGWNLDA